jgi:hypothetical protein
MHDDETTAPAPRKPVEQWAQEKGHATARRAWVFNATRTREQWVRGQEVTEAAYEAAIAATLTTQLG